MYTALLSVFWTISATPFFSQGQEKYSPDALLNELRFIQHQIYEVHANPWTEIDRRRYDLEVDQIAASITDSLTRYAFLKSVKPLFSWLSDEHADIDVSDSLAMAYGGNCLPFNLTEMEGHYFIDSLFLSQTELTKGIEILSIDGVAVKDLVKRCASYATGYPDQRYQKALSQFGFLYHFMEEEGTQYAVKTGSGKEVLMPSVQRKTWDDFIYPSNYKRKDRVEERICYAKYGKTGYITAFSFSVKGEQEYKRFEQVIDSIFKQINNDQIEELIIDVSNNPGGNSGVGNMLISYFYKGKIKSYQSTTKRSDEYLSLLKKWGIENPDYERHQPGETIFRPAVVSKTKRRRNFFKGKVYVVIGARTFSSAIMFATLIKDNNITPLIGEKPTNGHPTHFGEMYNTTTPLLGLRLRFGIKEWIRPAGKEGVNELIPDIAFSLKGAHKPEDVIALLNAHR